MKVDVAFMHGPRDLRIERIEIKPIEANEVLVKIGAVGICQSDVECFEGKSKEGRYDIAPYTPGHEWGGTVVEVGSAVRTLKPGNKVTGDCVMDCGVCVNCRSGRMPSACLNMRESGFRPDSPGAMGEYMVQEERFLHRFPDSWSFDEGVWIENFSVGYFGIWGNGGYVDASDDVIITGAGPIGLSALHVAKASGARVIVVDPLDNRLEVAKRYGADATVNPQREDLVGRIADLTEGQGGSLIVECSGNDAAIASIFDITGHSGRIRLVGHSIGRKIPIEIGKTIWRTASITGSGGTKTFIPRSIRFMDRIRGRVGFNDLITHRFEFHQILEAFDTAMKEKRSALKVVLQFK